MKNILIVVLGLCLIGMSIDLWVKSNKFDAERTIPEESSISIEAEEIAREVDEFGSEHVIYKEAEPIIKLIHIKVEDKAKIDSALRVVGIREKQLRSLEIITADVVSENLELKRNIGKDTVFIYKDKYLSMSFKPISDSLVLGSFSYNLDLKTLQYWKRSWFLGGKDNFIDVWSSDPRVKIKGLDRVSIRQKDPLFNIGFGAVTELHEDRLSFGTGIDLGIGKASIRGNYMYYPSREEWKPSFSIWYDLIRF